MRYLLLLTLLLTSCFARSAVMTRTTFDDIQVGEPIAQIESQIGEPYQIKALGANSYEYEYIEKVNLHYGYVIENHYFLTISDGKVVGKRYTQEKSPAYDLMYEADPNYPDYPDHTGY